MLPHQASLINDGFIKNRYVGRTFIERPNHYRKRGVALKYNVVNENILDKRVVLVDDSNPCAQYDGTFDQITAGCRGCPGTPSHHVPPILTSCLWCGYGDIMRI